MLQDNVIDIEPQQNDRQIKATKKWLARIKKEQDIHEDFRDQASDAWGVFLDATDDSCIYYPLLWSVVNIEHSAVFSGTPIPDIRPRNTDQNPIYSDAAQIMQRSLEFYLDQTEFQDNMDRTVDDYLVSALGVPRVKLDAEIVDTMDDMTGEDEPVITNQMVRIEHVPWDRFGWEPCSNWDHCEWIYFKHRLTKQEIRRRWGDVSLDADEDNNDNHRGRKSVNDKRKLYTVYEVWDKRNKEVLIIAKGNREPLEVNEDPLQLTGFFPIPKPMMLNLASDELIPTTDYTYIEPFDKELNRLYKRSRAITEQIKAVSFHDASIVELEDFAEIADGTSLPIENLVERFDGKPSIEAMMYFWPINERVQTLSEITQQIELKRRHVDDLLGISDILRGSSNPQEGVGTQAIKERWAGIRLRRKQVAVQMCIRDLFRMMAELTVEHVTPDNLSRMTQIEVTPEVYELLRNDLMREFAIDVESDSTIAKDEAADKRERTELLQSVTNYVQIVAPAMAQNLIPADLGKEILQVATDPYKKYSRGLDDVLENMPDTQAQLQKMNQQIQQGQQQNQQKDQQIQQMQYAIDQYSQAEEQRKSAESQAKVAKDQATAAKTGAGVQDETMQPALTEAETQYKQAQTVDTLRPDNADL